ncbi:MAG: amino acid ABC transporter ATP-binding protein [Ruminococcaceae bacterium]|nr:amino acid ABC transporter ATP-binding protein [Oscillospiraceae bacterium]
MAYFEVKNVSKSFGKTEVLKSIDFSMEKGQVVSIIGSSGSGKTTLLRCINFLCDPDLGEFYLEGEKFFTAGEKLKDKQIREKRMNFGLVFQQFNLFPQYNVKENLCLAPKLLAEEKEDFKEKKQEYFDEIEAHADHLLEQVGLTEKAENYPGELSGGQQQRVAIARALMLSPKILCFDEPTSALDPELTGEVLKVLRELAEKDITMIIVTHEMNFAREISDKVVFMADGVIAEEGEPEEMFSNPKSLRLRAFLAKTE